MAQLIGKGSYRSFRTKAKDTSPQIVVPWAPPGELVATTDATGKITGTLKFAHGWVALTINGSVTPAVENEDLPEGLVATGDGLSAVYNIQGFFIDDDHIVGTVVGVRNDLGEQPHGTSGPFALFRLSP